MALVQAAPTADSHPLTYASSSMPSRCRARAWSRPQMTANTAIMAAHMTMVTAISAGIGMVMSPWAERRQVATMVEASIPEVPTPVLRGPAPPSGTVMAYQHRGAA